MELRPREPVLRFEHNRLERRSLQRARDTGAIWIPTRASLAVDQRRGLGVRGLESQRLACDACDECGCRVRLWLVHDEYRLPAEQVVDHPHAAQRVERKCLARASDVQTTDRRPWLQPVVL